VRIRTRFLAGGGRFDLLRESIVSGLGGTTGLLLIITALVGFGIESLGVLVVVGLVAEIEITLGRKFLQELRNLSIVLDQDLAKIFRNVLVAVAIEARGQTNMTDAAAAT
jgi:hypothetical protein